MIGVRSGTKWVEAKERLWRWARRRVQGRLVQIVNYHSIAPADNPFIVGQGQRHAPEELAAHLAYLRRHFHPMRLADLIAAVEARRPLDRAVAVTFDDGFRDVLEFALPLLRAHRVPATMFVVTSLVGNAELMWRHKLTWLISHGRAARVYDALRAEFRRHGAELYRDPAAQDGAAQPDLFELTRRCYRPELVPPLLDELLREGGWNAAHLAAHHRPYVEPRDLERADGEWLEFGNHTHTHPMLSALTPAEQERELSVARDLLTRWTGRAPIAAAYPFGLADSYDAHTVDRVARTGHRAALDMRRRVNAPGVSPLELSRKPAPHGDARQFERTLEDWRFSAPRLHASRTSEGLLLNHRMFRGSPRPVRTMLRPYWETPGTPEPTSTLGGGEAS